MMNVRSRPLTPKPARRRRTPVRRVVWFLLLLLCGAPAFAQQPQPAESFLTTALAGEWAGHGRYQENDLTLSRHWSNTLGDQFLRGDLRVTMPNGSDFRTLTFWQCGQSDTCKTVWLDEAGRLRTAEAALDADIREAHVELLDDYSEDTPVLRRWVYRIESADRYSELLFEYVDGEWRQAGEFSLLRVPERTDSE